jgi:3D (Asp-Asp-Asp) domain-containing protein
MKSILSGSALIASALLVSSLALSAKPSVAETLLAQFQQQKQATKKTGDNETQGTKGTAPGTDASPGADQKTAPDAASGDLSGVVTEATDPAGAIGIPSAEPSAPLTQPTAYVATAYSLSGRMASGRRPSKGVIAADPSVLPLGSRVRVEAGNYSGEYVVADTGGSVRGKKIDIWTPSSREANRFGRRLVKLTVLSYGPRRAPARRHKR